MTRMLNASLEDGLSRNVQSGGVMPYGWSGEKDAGVSDELRDAYYGI